MFETLSAWLDDQISNIGQIIWALIEPVEAFPFIGLFILPCMLFLLWWAMMLAIIGRIVHGLAWVERKVRNHAR